ncbi:hypothetical protein [uncultured Clostridium sp.]|uniref:hypothetical protein n=1 Tax=uncultured Clostridium sp. TaxID=59620 RepID=UPI00258313D0|nr:hypothetical protein [uncultured Clostridium sp.]
MKKELNNLFKNMSKDNLMDFFEECGIKVECVELGKGGFFVDNKEINDNQICNQDLKKNIYNRISAKRKYKIKDRCVSSVENEFVMNERSRRAA